MSPAKRKIILSTTLTSLEFIHETTEMGVHAPKGFTSASFMLSHILHSMMKSCVLSYSPHDEQAEDYITDKSNEPSLQ